MVAEVGWETLVRRGEAFDSFEGDLFEGQPSGEMGVGGQGRDKPVSQLFDLGLEGEVEIVESNP